MLKIEHTVKLKNKTMKKVLLIIVLFVFSFGAKAQNSLWLAMPHYPACDTVECHFLEVIDDSTVKWQTGFVRRTSGRIEFGKTSVTPEYLPVTSGVVTSQLFYTSRKLINNYAIQVILKPIGKKETSVIGLK
jgi:hypothetical protein